MTENPIVSPDGAWRWDGTTWQPNDTPAAPADPTLTETPPAADPTPAPAPTPPASSSSTDAASGSPGANVGEVVTVQMDEDSTPYQGLVVGLVEGNAEGGEVLRETGVLVVPLPDATFVPNAALKD